MRDGARVHLESGLTEQTIDVDADVDVRVTTRFTPVAVAGMAALALGMAAIVVGSAMFVAAYPDTWYAVQATEAESLGTIEAVAVTVGGGVTLFFLGMALFFHGRQVLGRGGTTHSDVVAGVEAEGVEDVAQPEEDASVATATAEMALEPPVTAFDAALPSAGQPGEDAEREEPPVEAETDRANEAWP